jgi:hypothetical protein
MIVIVSRYYIINNTRLRFDTQTQFPFFRALINKNYPIVMQLKSDYSLYNFNIVKIIVIKKLTINDHNIDNMNE